MTKENVANTMIINSIDDLVNLVNHNNEVFSRGMKKVSKRCNKLITASFLVTCGVLCLANKIRKQEEELYKLSIQVKKLEDKEGE